MNTTLRRGEDGALSDALAGILGRLRGRPYERPAGVPEETLHAVADRFVGRLAEHLRYSEGTLFPALRDLEPEIARAIESLKEEHRLLHRLARDLSLRIRGGDPERVCGVARPFLAVLLDHLRHESRCVERLVGSLGVLDARRLTTILCEAAK